MKYINLKILSIFLILLIISPLNAKSGTSSTSTVGKVVSVGKVLIKNIPKVKKILTSSKKSKISNKGISMMKSLNKSKSVLLSNSKTALTKLGKKISSNYIKKTIPKKSGLYTYKEKTSKPYIGVGGLGKKSTLQTRLLTHVRSGKLPYSNINTVRTKSLPKQELRSIEKSLIMKADKYTNGGLANKQHAKLSRTEQKKEKNRSLLKTKF